MNPVNPPLFGLVLAGGKSSRMGKDKSQLIYSQKPQFQAAFELLSQVCAQVFISSRIEQSQQAMFASYPVIIDCLEYQGKGPISGILSAMKQYPDVSWLILACDLPFVSIKTLSFLVANRDRQLIATAYCSERDGLPEPLCAIWEQGNFLHLEGFFKQDIYCPRKILIKSNVNLCPIQIKGELDNINHPHEVTDALTRLQKRKD